jgi:hypothetical protein
MKLLSVNLNERDHFNRFSINSAKGFGLNSSGWGYGLVAVIKLCVIYQPDE